MRRSGQRRWLHLGLIPFWLPPLFFSDWFPLTSFLFLICSKDMDEKFSRLACPLLFSSLLSFFLSFVRIPFVLGNGLQKNDFLYSCFWFPLPFGQRKKKRRHRKGAKKYGVAVIFNTRLLFFSLFFFHQRWVFGFGIWEKHFTAMASSLIFSCSLCHYYPCLLFLYCFFSSRGTQSRWWPAAYCGHFNPKRLHRSVHGMQMLHTTFIYYKTGLSNRSCCYLCSYGGLFQLLLPPGRMDNGQWTQFCCMVMKGFCAFAFSSSTGGVYLSVCVCVCSHVFSLFLYNVCMIGMGCWSWWAWITEYQSWRNRSKPFFSFSFFSLFL